MFSSRQGQTARPTSQTSRKKIAIFTADDPTWALSTWMKTLPLLIQNYDVVGIYLFPDRLGSLKGNQTLVWYGRIFGLYNVAIMALYAIKTKIRMVFAPIGNWQQLAREYQLQLLEAESPNDAEVINWTETNDIDIVLIMVGNILKPAIINAPKIGVINKHASLLPSCRGLFPSFWGRLTGAAIGVTFHQVDEGIDTGKALVEVSYGRPQGSMLRFYMDTFAIYPQMAVAAVEKLIDREYLPGVNRPSAYYSLPTRADYCAYRRRGFKIAQASDLFYVPNPDHVTPPCRSAVAVGALAETLSD
jgi:methionyl-tRNA formyltransferase